MKKNLSIQRSDKKKNVLEKLVLVCIGGVIGFLNGFFGGGGGMVCVPTLEKVLKLDNKRSHATAIAVIFPLSLVSCAVYIFKGAIESLPLLTVGLGVLVGGIGGSIALKFLPSKVIRIIFAVLMLAGGVRLII